MAVMSLRLSLSSGPAVSPPALLSLQRPCCLSTGPAVSPPALLSLHRPCLSLPALLSLVPSLCITRGVHDESVACVF